MTALRVAVLAESPTDDEVAREIVAHVRRIEVDAVDVPSLQARGWPAVIDQLPTVVRTVHYHSDADVLIVLADTDTDVLHDPTTHTLAAPGPGCRFCRLQTELTHVLDRLGPRPTQQPLYTALGTPVPAVEGWLLAGQAPHPSEAAWLQHGSRMPTAYKRQLKAAAYNSVEARRNKPGAASTLIRRALAQPDVLRTAFPGGYAPLEDAIRSW